MGTERKDSLERTASQSRERQYARHTTFTSHAVGDSLSGKRAYLAVSPSPKNGSRQFPIKPLKPHATQNVSHYADVYDKQNGDVLDFPVYLFLHLPQLFYGGYAVVLR